MESEIILTSSVHLPVPVSSPVNTEPTQSPLLQHQNSLQMQQKNDAYIACLESKRRLCIYKQTLYKAFMDHFDSCYINRHKKICGCEILSQYLELLVEINSFEGQHDLAQAFNNMNNLLNSIQSQKSMVHFVKHTVSNCNDIRVIQELNNFFKGVVRYEITTLNSKSYKSDCECEGEGENGSENNYSSKGDYGEWSDENMSTDESSTEKEEDKKREKEGKRREKRKSSRIKFSGSDSPQTRMINMSRKQYVDYMNS